MNNERTNSAAGTPSAAAEIYGHLIPLQEAFLIVPKLAVSEVMGMDAVAVQTSGPAWLLGTAQSRGKHLPVVSFEAMRGDALPARSRRSRLVVMNSFGDHLEDARFILLTQGYPHLTALNAAAMKPQPRRPQDEELCLSRVSLASTQAVIPDLDAMEMRIAGVLSQIDEEGVATQPWQPSL